MDVQGFLAGLDELFANKKMGQAEIYLESCYEEAKNENDLPAQFTILNEMMGYFRDTSKYDKSLKSCADCLKLMEQMNIKGTTDYATALQNIANANRAAGKLKESLKFYNQALEIYDKTIAPTDFRMAGINNNIALLCQEMGDYESAVAHLKKALSIIRTIEGTEIEIAITYSNLGASLIELNRVDEAVEYLNKALKTFRKDKIKDFHYSAALSAMAAAKCKTGNYESAVKLYEEALAEIETNMGRGTAYKITLDNLKRAQEKLMSNKKVINTAETNQSGVNSVGKYKYKENATDINKDTENSASKNTLQDVNCGIEEDRKFYEEHGRKMVHDKFEKYEDKIAVGLVGEGSERFGFDDRYSRDHDFQKGFCMWVTDETYEEIGNDLQYEYEKLIRENEDGNGFNSKTAAGRFGVQRINEFYKKYTGYSNPPENVEDWIEIDDYKLATVTNGMIFVDNEGKFTEIRNKFEAIPEKARRVKIAREVAAMAQTGQYNYARCMARKDYVTSNICISEFMQHTIKCVYLLNKKYAPYYKWMLKGMENLDILSEIADIIKQMADMPDQRNAWNNYEYDSGKVNFADEKVSAIENIAQLIIVQLAEQKLIGNMQNSTNFLNDFAFGIMRETEVEEMDREQLIDKIIEIEFEQFDKVKNRGGRAECQNNFPTFNIMRRSQYMTWTDEMLQALYRLWIFDVENGNNMVREKYARMMESTAPEEYRELESVLPEKSERTKKIVDQIVEIQVGWMEEFAEKYPKLAGNARDITSENDNLYNTSYETYLRGELLTYSDDLIKLYAQFIVDLAREQKNLARMTIENTAHLLGYDSLEKAEKEI